MIQETTRDRQIAEVSKKRVKYVLPTMGGVVVHHDAIYRSVRGTPLQLDLYHSGEALKRRRPVVVLPMSYPDPTARVREYGPLTSWAGLIAAMDMAAVLYGTESPAEDVDSLLAYLRANADTLGLDMDRVGVYAASANVTVGLSTLMRDHRVRCGAFMYGYTMDDGASTAVADAARQMGFVNACLGRSIADIPAAVPLLFVRAGLDVLPGLNEALDCVIAGALGRNLPLSVINHATGAHGFDLDEDSTTSREIVQHVLRFLSVHLDAAS